MPLVAVYYQGAALRIDITVDGEESLRSLYAEHKGDQKVLAALARTDRLIRRLADMGRLKSREEFKQEVPKDNVYPAFWAIRALPVRTYGWYVSDKAFVISHAICKRRDRLSSADIERMRSNSK